MRAIADLELELEAKAFNFLLTLTTFNETKIRAITTPDIIGCFEVAQNGHLGCFLGILSFLGYTSILNYTETEFAINTENITRFEYVTSVTRRRTMMYINWDIFNIQTDTLCHIKMTVTFGFNCTNFINYYGVQVDTGDSKECQLPVVSDCNATRICLGGVNTGGVKSVRGVMEVCQGENQVYATAEDCIGFIESLPCHGPQFAYGNTTECRDWHKILSAPHPEIHCVHTSKDGGGKCVNF